MSNRDDLPTRIRQLLPLRELPADVRAELGIVREGRSRPKVIARAPPKPDTYLEDLAQLRAEAVAADPVLSAMSDQRRRLEVLDATIKEVAIETAALAFERIQAERRGIDIGPLCSRRVAGLAQIASLVAERAKIGGEPEVDPRDPRVQRLVAYFFDSFAEVAIETLGAKEGQRFVDDVRSRVRGWEDRIG